MNRILWLFLIVTRLRDRLRCPSCSAVGTYKLHAPVYENKYVPSVWMSRYEKRQIRPWRWLCKWCGYYDGPEGKGLLCCPSPDLGCWIFREQESGFKGRTPQKMVSDGAKQDRETVILRQTFYEPPFGEKNVRPSGNYEPWPWRG